MGKTKPFTIRFDEDKLAFVKKERNLEKEQSVVDFLLEHYYWVKKLAGDDVPNKIVLQEKDIQILEGINKSQNEGKEMMYNSHSSLGGTITKAQSPKVKPEPPEVLIKPIVMSQYQIYAQEIKEARTTEEMTAISKAYNKDSDVSLMERRNLDILAKEVSKEFYND